MLKERMYSLAEVREALRKFCIGDKKRFAKPFSYAREKEMSKMNEMIVNYFGKDFYVITYRERLAAAIKHTSARDLFKHITRTMDG